MTARLRGAVLALSFLLSGVGVTACDVISPTDNTLMDQLRRAEEVWQERGVTSYAMTMQVSSYVDETVPTVRVTVVNGQVVSLVNVDTGEEYPVTGSSPYRTVTGVHDLIRDALNQRVAGIFVRYDPDYGFAAALEVDYDQRRIDDNLLIQVTDFQPAD